MDDLATDQELSFQIKVPGPIHFHLGCNCERDEYGTISMAPQQYLEQMVEQCEQIFRSRSRTNKNLKEMMTSSLQLLEAEEINISNQLFNGKSF